MFKYVDAEKLKKSIGNYMEGARAALNPIDGNADYYKGKIDACKDIQEFITSRQQEQPAMIQWTGNNLKEVIDFTGKSPRFEEWFNSWEEYENYVHSHNDILKLFYDDGSHYEVPVGAWIFKTSEGYYLPSVAKYIQQEQPEGDLEKEIQEYCGDRNVRPVPDLMEQVARHFAEWGAIHLNARKEE